MDSDDGDVDAKLPVTAYTVKDIPKGMWKYWEPTVRGTIKYSRLGDRIIDLVAADLALQDATGSGLLELALAEELDEEDLDAAKERQPPEES